MLPLVLIYFQVSLVIKGKEKLEFLTKNNLGYKSSWPLSALREPW